MADPPAIPGSAGRRPRRGRVSAALLVLAVAAGAALYAAYTVQRAYREKELEIRRLARVVERLEAETRRAQVIVTKQGVNPATGRLETTLKFMETGPGGDPLPPRYFTVEGDVVYFDALVIRFEREYVERGDALRGKSICLFRRVFGEHQAPEEGFPVDRAAGAGEVPDVYRVNPDPTPFERELWKEFWRYAADPAAARAKGVRVIQGEAVYTRFIPGNLYTLTLDHGGGLSIKVEPIPAILRDELIRKP